MPMASTFSKTKVHPHWQTRTYAAKHPESKLKNLLKKKKKILRNCKSCRNQNPSRYYISIMNLKFQYKPKYHILQILISKYSYYIGGKIP